MANIGGFSMRQYLLLFLLMGLLAVASVSSTDYLYAYGNIGGIESLSAEDDRFELKGTSGYLDEGYGDGVVLVSKTNKMSDVEFEVETFTRCSVIGVHYTSLRIVINDGPYEGETGWVYRSDYHKDED
jgi:hypothetical protein